MADLTTSQVTLLVTAFSLAAGLIGWFGRGLSFLLVRWWTGSTKQERASYLNTVADLATKLRSHGMTIDEVREFEEMVHHPSVASSATANKVIEQLAAEAGEPEAFQSNMAMKMRTGAAYEVAEAKLGQALMDLHLLVNEGEWECIEKAQQRWKAYREALEDCALREYQGGTHATLAMALVGMSETERRTDEILAQIAERAAR